ncbi:MAG: universal stress protein, partial [Deltaproteobacteria bacterium]|nr:universal stress protein [Deltaproteobacteria bacterium]
MFKNILVIFENEKVSDHAVKYACELAHRMDSNVTFLMLMEMTFPNRLSIDSQRKSIQKIESRISKILGEMSSELLKQGIPVSVALRVGDASIELLKFLAERDSFQTVIWGSDEKLPDSSHGRKTHWMAKVAGILECPLIAAGGLKGEGGSG